MDAAPQAPVPQPLAPVYVPVVQQKSPIGSIVLFMGIGALIAVTLLYIWGAEVSKEIRTVPQEMQ